MTKVLLTGAFGFFGNYLRAGLRDSTFDTISLDRNEKADIVLDVSEPFQCECENLEMVVHAAGLAHTLPKTEQEEELFYKINYKGTVNLCRALDKNPPNTFVFISTIAVYGRDSGILLKEDEPLNGTTPYALSKIKAERFLEGWCKEKRVNCVILRLPLVAGSNAKGNLGAMINGIKRGYYFNIKGSQAKKSIVLAEDVARLVPTLKGKNGTYNLAGPKDYTFQEISKIIADQLNEKSVLSLPQGLVRFLARVGDILPFLPIDTLKLSKIMNDLTVSSEKAVNELNWKPRPLSSFKI